MKPTSSHSSNYSSSLVPSKDSPSFIALHEGFKYFEKDLSKLQNFVEINATGFRKILKKWDKRSKSQTKEIFLTRQVEVQPCFNREFIAELSDVVAANLQELENIGEEEVNSTGKRNVNGSSKGNSTIEKMDGLEEDQQSMNELGMNTTSTTPMLNAGMKIGNGEEEYDALNDLEQALRDSIKNSRTEKARELIRVAKESLLSSETEEEDEGNVQGHFKSSSTLSDANHSSQAQTHVSRLVWRALLESSPNAIQNAISNHLVDFNFLDDINYRTCLHEASRAGNLQLVKLCVENGVEIRKKDAYGREAISYAAMMGHDEVCGYLLEVANGSNGKKDDRMDQDLDMDGFSPLVLAVINGRSKVVKILLDHGVLVEVPNPSIKLGGGTSQQRSAFPSVTSPSTFSSDLNPLCLASEGGHLDIVSLLIQRGATIQQNPEGLTPQALAARSGHHEILQLLLKNGSNSNVVEKGSKWTPIFFAAENGWTECIKVLLQNGADPNKLDEKNRKAEFYAAWNGKIDCLKILKEAEEEIETKGLNKVSSSSDDSSSTKSEKKKKKEKVGTDGDVEMEDLDLDLEIDGIPSLSLPPPIIPFRTYGHNYLDKRALVSVSLTNNSIKLYKHQDPNVPEPFSANSIKLVMTAKPDSSPRTAASSSTPSSKLSLPHSLNILFPLSDDSEVFSFQVDSLSKFSIQWELMSTFGSKVIGKAVALPSSFEGMTDRKRFVLPLQDSFLKLVGEISFEIDFVKPFDSVILEIGGKVETYWKSLLPSRENVTTSNSTRMTPLGASSDSSILAPKNLTNQVSPQTVSLPPIPPIATTASSTAPAPSLVTASSLSGSYLRITVQVTKDGIPVVFPHLGLPVPTPPGLNLNLDVYVGNVTATQFLGFAEATGKTVRKDKLQNLEGDEEEALGKWRDELDGRMITLENLLEVSRTSFSPLKVLDRLFSLNNDFFVSLLTCLDSQILPVPIGIDLHLLYPSSADVRGNPSLPKLEVNHFVDTILHKVYAAGTLSPQQSRKILFSSRSPTVCTALNWKQPNCEYLSSFLSARSFGYLLQSRLTSLLSVT